MISSALHAAGIRIFGRHPKDGSPQGLFCANGQCSQCLVLADGKPVKACMTPVRPGMRVEPLEQLPDLPPPSAPVGMRDPETIAVPALILGGGPAGMSAAVELAGHRVEAILVDDKDRLGGKLVLQTHRFFGSSDAVYAGTRGIDIGARLAREVEGLDRVDVWLNSTALAVFSDRRVGILHGDRYVLVAPEVLLVATGAREKSLVFQGNTLPGVYGAGAFQTLVNRDLVRPSDRLFVIGGGNVGLIAGYHALQAGIDVVGLVEALPECGGYKVHRDKLARMGVPIYTSHTILSANGREEVESVTIANVDETFRPVEGTERSFDCDTVLVAVGLDPVDEFRRAGETFGLPTLAAGDADEIAEASAAIFSGKMAGREIARRLGATNAPVPAAWRETCAILKSKPGRVVDRTRIDAYLSRPSTPQGQEQEPKVVPVFHCRQKIPCDPCTAACPRGLIRIEGDMRNTPIFVGPDVGEACLGCARCVAVCPGLAITLVDRRDHLKEPLVTIPFEFEPARLAAAETAVVLDIAGNVLGEAPIVDIESRPADARTRLVKIRAPNEIAEQIAGIRIQPPWIGEPLPEKREPLADGDIVCRCERVTAGEIRDLIRSGIRDVNEIKTITRAGMGACGGKTCQSLILRLFRDEGIPLEDVTECVRRPLFVEVPLGTFAGACSTDRRSMSDRRDDAPGSGPEGNSRG